MRTITKLQTLLVLFLTTAMVCFMGCKDDDDDVPTPGGGGTVATYAIMCCFNRILQSTITLCPIL